MGKIENVHVDNSTVNSNSNSDNNLKLNEYKEKLEWQQEVNHKLNTELTEALATIEELKYAYDKCEQRYLEVSAAHSSVVNTRLWKIINPLRVCVGKFMDVLRFFHIDTVYHLTKNGFRRLRQDGFVKTYKYALKKFKKPKRFNYSVITPERRAREEAVHFKLDIKFSILVPLYNTPQKYLKEMIDSVVNQTYPNWELCLADGSDDEHKYVEEIVKEYINNDKRIVYKKLEENLGISDNTNACMAMATGNYIALFDHDDYLHPSVLFENMKAIESTGADFLYTDEATFEGDNITKIITYHFKPDFAIDNLIANNYICHFSVFSRELMEKTGGFRHEFDGSQDHDMIMRLTSNAKKIYHIRKLLYFWRSHPNSVAADINSKTYAIDSGKRAVTEMITKMGYSGTVMSSKAFPTIYRIKYDLIERPLVTIVIANSDHRQDLEKCITSILKKSTYSNFNIVIVENGSCQEDIFAYYKELRKNDKIKIVNYSEPFNYSAVNNLGVKHATGKYIILLNNDTEVITPNWIEEMLMYAQRKDVGIVGPKLYYADDTIQHAGIVLGLGEHRVAGHCHYKLPKQHLGYMGKLYYSQNVSAVTGACMMFRKDVFEQVGGLDAGFKFAFNDVDLCLKFRQLGYLIVFTPYAELYHYESKSRGLEDTKEKKARFLSEVTKFHKKWDKSVLDKGDPYYNPNFSLDIDYQVEYEKLQKECRE